MHIELIFPVKFDGRILNFFIVNSAYLNPTVIICSAWSLLMPERLLILILIPILKKLLEISHLINAYHIFLSW